MKTKAGLSLALAGLALLFAAPHVARACSCMGPRLRILGPVAVDDVPRNARVQLESPSAETGGLVEGDGRLVLRVHGGAEVAVKTASSPDGRVSRIELTPERPLDASTLYEVALVDRRTVPPNRVLAAFRTGTAEDHTAPVLRGTPAVKVLGQPGASSAACQLAGPWLEISGLAADDPGRPSARLAWAVWIGSDTTKTPWAMRFPAPDDAALRVGASHLCDSHSRGLPKGPVLDVSVAAVDEAGNRSPPRRFTVDLRTARRP